MMSQRASACYFKKEKTMRTLACLIVLASGLTAQEGQFCTERTIQGSYGLTFNGAMPASPAPGAPVIEGRGVGIRIFDGRGNFSEVVSIKSVNNPGFVDQSHSGTYTIKPDCTGTAFLNVPGLPSAAEFRFVVVKNGKEIFFTLIKPIGPSTLTHCVQQ
jgi:hypothetical protein